MTEQSSHDHLQSPQRVVILGGGPAGVSAAYWLSAPEQNGRYKVALYTQGWRLGGKCASGRNVGLADSIEEHGLHVLMGCYHNAFATLRSCYLDWRERKSDPDNPLQVWTDGFKPQRKITLMDKDPQTGWQPWNFDFPRFPGEPGDGPLVGDSQHQPLPSDEQMILGMAKRIEDAIPEDAPFRAAVVRGFNSLKVAFESGVHPMDPALAELTAAAHAAQKYIGPDKADAPANQASASAASLWRKLAIFADLGISIAIGFMLDLFGRGESAYDALNTKDFRAWIGEHGATKTTQFSPLVNAIYDLAFAAVDGAEDSPGSLAAGVSFRAQLEMAMGYRNAPLFRMVAGTADTVFTPLYDVLIERGVEINFFSRVEELTARNAQLAEIKIQRQAAIKGGKPYQPLRRVTLASGKQLDSWPNEPFWEQLEDGTALKKKGVDFDYSGCDAKAGEPTYLTAGVDFDIAISALPPLVLEPISRSVQSEASEWGEALAESASVATQAMQLWMEPDLAQLGWEYGSVVLTSYAVPYDSWGDMGEILPFENWTNQNVWTGTVPATLGYFCGTLDLEGDLINRGAMKSAADAIAAKWMADLLPGLWPNVGHNGATKNVVASYIRPNFDLAEQYVQTPAGSNVGLRLDPAKPAGLTNCYAIGDWTKTRFSGGCFESAVESAMLAVRGISGFPQDIKTS